VRQLSVVSLFNTNTIKEDNMSYKLNAKILQDLATEHDELVELLKTMCKIPAPLNHEEKRAEFCKKWLEDMGAKNVYIDEALNVIYPLNCQGNNKVHIFSAHTDTVFPDTEPMPMSEKDGKLYCPGVGDDTASLATLMMAAKYITKHGYIPDEGCVFVCNSGEEGFGNSKGCQSFYGGLQGQSKNYGFL
jgi:acetylornithine deacetylase/succinyl-diaminopimelate desuccinylase-like protein